MFLNLKPRTSRAFARRLSVCCALLAAVAGPGFAQTGEAPVVAPALPVVRRFEDFSNMPGDRRDLAHPIEIEGDVIYVDPGWKMMFVQTSGWMHYIETGGATVGVRVGQHVRMTGTVVPARGLKFDAIRFEVIGDTPPAAYPELERLAEVDKANALVAMVRGLVDRQEMSDDTHLRLEIAHRGSSFPVVLCLPAGAPIPTFAGAFVRAKGLYNPTRDIVHGSSSFEVLVAGAQDVEVVGWLATDPAFDRVVTPIGDLTTIAPGAIAHVVGTVHAHVPGESVTLRDATGQVDVMTGQKLAVAQDVPVEAVGLPHADGLRWILRDGYVRTANREPVEMATLGLPVLRLVGQVLDLPEGRASLHGPVRLAGAVAWSHREASHFYLLDATGGVRVALPPGAEPPVLGAAVGIEGTTDSGSFAPGVVASSITVIGSIALPEARDITYEQAWTGMEDGQWVAMRGLVRAVVEDGPWTRVELSTTGGDVAVLTRRDASLAARVGAIVRARGICAVQANSRRQLTGVQLWMRTPDDLHVEEAAPDDPFSIATSTIAGMRRFSTFQTANRRIRIAGTVTSHQPGRFIYIQDSGDSLQVLSRGRVPLQPGDQVEVVGLPGKDAGRLVLREAVYRRTGVGGDPVPTRIDEHLSPDAAYESRLVRLEARLLERTIGAKEHRFVLENQGVIFEARLEGRDFSLDDLESQSRVELTGIYSVVHDEYRSPRGFMVSLRSPGDIVVREPPPRLNAERAAALAGIFAVVLLLGLFWVASLRRRVRKQTDQLREQLASEAELKARQRDILENANDCIFTTDLEGRLTAFNRAGERLSGYSPDEALRLHLRDLFAGVEDCARALAQLRAEEGGGATFETRFRRKDGHVVWVEVSSRLVAVDGRPAGLLGIVRDVSERRKFEDDLAAARDAAQASAASKSSFLANMSHEIRTPMNGVIGMANLLLDTPLAHEQRDFAQTIRDSAEALLTILNDILDFSKIEAGKLQFESEPFDVSEAVDGTLELLAARAAAKGIELAAFVPRSVPRRVLGDSGRLRQVLLNLVGNAIKFTESGNVTIQVACVAQETGHTVLRFEIVDTGVGLSPEAQARLFRPFEQADGSTTRRFGGTGLGLAISRQIVGLMGGQIGVRSAPGEGSTFWFTGRFGHAAARAEAAPEATLRDGRILVVEANRETRRIIADHLSAWDAAVAVAAEAGEALAAIRLAVDRGAAFDLALVDINAVADGDLATFCAAARAVPGCAGLRFVGLVPVDRRRHAVPGAMALLPKPLRRDSLIDTVRTVLAGGEATLPLAIDAAPVALLPVPAPTAPDSSGVRCLVVDDNIVNQRVARLILGKFGLRIDVAGNGLEAIAAIERADYDAVFMDCQMPEMDGYEATRRLRASGRHEGLRIIAMTANAMEGDRERCLAAGMDDYVSKPMRPEELRAALERADVLTPAPQAS